MIEEKFMNRKMFGDLVTESVLKKKLSYIDAVLYICEQEGIDPEDVKKFLSSQIRDKIEAEAISLNHLPSKNTLTFES